MLAISKFTIEEAYEKWEIFENGILYQNRFHISDEIRNELYDIAQNCERVINQGTILYRAREYKEKLYFPMYLRKGFATSVRKENGKFVNNIFQNIQDDIDNRRLSKFWGHDSNNSFVPPSYDYIKGGRANPSYIKYLYVAESAYTAMVEIRPFLETTVSIADIEVIKELKIVDLSYDLEEYFTDHNWLGNIIMRQFSRACDSDDKQYIPLQFISEFFKSIGYDGIRFSSSLDKNGYNLTVFNYHNCKPISSKLYEVSNIQYNVIEIAPNCEKY